MLQGGDMIANLNSLPEYHLEEGFKMKRVFAGDKQRVLEFVKANFSDNWIWETELAIMQEPGKCFIVTKDGEIMGFACYDSSAKGYFGPIGVREDMRKQGIGEALLIRTFQAMYEYGYGYAIIGWVSDAENFYRKTVGAEWIKGGNPENTVYSNIVAL